MKQQKLGLTFGVTYGPQAVQTEIVKSCKSYKDAVRLSWAMRRIRKMTQSHCAAICGFYPPHLSQWLSDKEGMPDMPAKHLKEFCGATGNLLPVQYLNQESELTVMEEVQANIRAKREGEAA